MAKLVCHGLYKPNWPHDWISFSDHKSARQGKWLKFSPFRAHEDKLIDFKLSGFNLPYTQMAPRDRQSGPAPLKIGLIFFLFGFFEYGIIWWNFLSNTNCFLIIEKSTHLLKNVLEVSKIVKKKILTSHNWHFAVFLNWIFVWTYVSIDMYF